MPRSEARRLAVACVAGLLVAACGSKGTTVSDASTESPFDASAGCMPQCSGTTPDCIGGSCSCNAVSCPEGAVCEDRACVPVVGCNGEACFGTTPWCEGGHCICTATSCLGGQFCSAAGKCQPYESGCMTMTCADPAKPGCLDVFEPEPRSVCACTPASCPDGARCVDHDCQPLPACAATETLCGAVCCRKDVEWCDTNRLSPKCLPHWGHPWTDLQVTFGESGIIDGAHVQTLAGSQASWEVDALLLNSSSATLSFRATVEREAGVLPGSNSDFVGAALLAQVVGRCFFPSNDAMNVKASPVVAVPATCASPDQCGADFSVNFDPVVCPESTTLLAYAVSFSWLRVLSGSSGRTYQWLQSDYPRGCLADQSCDTHGSFWTYGPLDESLTAPIEDWKDQTFDYVEWTRQHFGPP